MCYNQVSNLSTFLVSIMQRSILVLFLAFSSALAFAAEPQTKEQPAVVPAVTTVPAREDFIIIPLRLYRMKSTTKAEANAEIKDQDLQRIWVKSIASGPTAAFTLVSIRFKMSQPMSKAGRNARRLCKSCKRMPRVSGTIGKRISRE